MRLRSSSSAPLAPSPAVPSIRKSDCHQDTPQPERLSAAESVPQKGTPRDGASVSQRTPFATLFLSRPPFMSSSPRDPASLRLDKVSKAQLPPDDYHAQGNQRERKLSEEAIRGSSASGEVFLAIQYDGTMDIEPASTTQPVPLLERTSPASPSVKSVHDQDVRPASPHLVDVNMGEPEEAAVQGELLEEYAMPRVNAEKEGGDMDQAAVKPSDPGTADLGQKKGHEPPLPSQGILPPANAAQNRPDGATPHMPAEAPTRLSKVAEAPSAALTEGEMMDVNSGEDNLEYKERNKNQIPTLSQSSRRDLKYGRTEEYRLREVRSVQSYLAWLQHRQTRFPTAPPNSSEVILIAEKLNRSEAMVYDEILYRWGLETNSQCGAWYRQNRLTVLGEDPKFDEETMGKWEAWVKEGRDILAGRAS